MISSSSASSSRPDVQVRIHSRLQIAETAMSRYSEPANPSLIVPKGAEEQFFDADAVAASENGWEYNPERTKEILETELGGREILERALSIERSLGRVRPAPVAWGPRTLDLDLLWIEGEVIAEPDLDVPHPRLHEPGRDVEPHDRLGL